MILSILVAKISWTGLRIKFFDEYTEVGYFMAHVINFERSRLPTRFRSGFQLSFRLEIITNTDNKVKLHVVMDLLAKTIITPPCNLNVV